jgi:hypothetical protein
VGRTVRWRLPVAPRDGVQDGHIETGGLDPTDTPWEYGIEYLDEWFSQARAEWEAWDLDPALFTVDVVAPSTGGLVTRSYLQSDLYRTGEIDQFLMLGTPNHGAVDAYAMRESIDPFLGVTPVVAVETVAEGLTEVGPAHASAGTTMVAGAHVLNSRRAEDYIPAITDLLPTFDVISTVWPHKWVHGSDDNTLLADSAQLPGIAGVAIEALGHLNLAGADIRVQQEVFAFFGIPVPGSGFACGAFRSLAEGMAGGCCPWSGCVPLPPHFTA